MNLLNIFRRSPKIPPTWTLVATTQSVDLNETNLLFLNDQGEFKTIEMTGTTEIPIQTHINNMKKNGLQNITFVQDQKKFVVLEYPEEPEALPIRPPKNAAQNNVPAQ